MPEAVAERALPGSRTRRRRRWPPEASILMVLVGLALAFELLGWIFVQQSFLLNEQRLVVMILQVSVIGIIAIGVTQVIITGGIDLSSGSVVALTAMVAASLAQAGDAVRPVYPALIDLPVMCRWPRESRLGPRRASSTAPSSLEPPFRPSLQHLGSW